MTRRHPLLPFNVILMSGIVPSDWCIGLIKPLFENKGSTDNPDNYRGITLLSCIGKLFTATINAWFSLYLDAAELFGEEQAGFREGYSTMDHIFVLSSLVDWYLFHKKSLLCIHRLQKGF